MLKKIDAKNMYLADHGWLKSKFHFSFAEYRNMDNINFGVLRVLNDDIIQGNTGFDKHPHRDMEIISYIIDGELTHEDSMANKETLKSGEVQYMSAGKGVMHSEKNESSKDMRLLQIWIIPPEKSLASLYGSHRFTENEKHNKLLNIVSSQKGNAKIKIYQDVNIFVSKLDENKSIKISMENTSTSSATARQIYFVQIEGSSDINGIELNHGDAMEITKEDLLSITALTNSHFLFIEMPES